jgi:hypothetical protein
MHQALVSDAVDDDDRRSVRTGSTWRWKVG